MNKKLEREIDKYMFFFTVFIIDGHNFNIYANIDSGRKLKELLDNVWKGKQEERINY